MSTTTSTLSLFKYNTATDGTSTFSITSALNNNWDKIDSFASGVNAVFNSTSIGGTGKNIFTTINNALANKLEAEVSLSENGYIKFNSSVTFYDQIYAKVILLIFSVYKIARYFIYRTFSSIFSLLYIPEYITYPMYIQLSKKGAF